MDTPPVAFMSQQRKANRMVGRVRLAFPAPCDNKITGNHEGSMKLVVFYFVYVLYWSCKKDRNWPSVGKNFHR